MKPLFTMPAEWEKHAATWLTWPHNPDHWPERFAPIPAYWARMAKEISTGETVHILLHDKATRKNAEEELGKIGAAGGNIRLHDVPNNFAWARDHGPIFVRDINGAKNILHWRYNAWGNKWPHDLDESIPSAVSAITGIPEIKIPMVLEGGSIDVNGLGTLLTTESCLLHKNRNPKFTKEQIEEYLKKYLGIAHILWLGDGIAGDDTNGHIDDLTRFIGPSTVVTVVAERKDDRDFAALKENLSRLEKMTDQDGNRLTIHTVPLPSPVMVGDLRLPASYANFYIANDVVLLPVFDDPNDEKAVRTLQEAFPTRRIAAIDARDLVWGLGAFHCVTQQEPL